MFSSILSKFFAAMAFEPHTDHSDLAGATMLIALAALPPLILYELKTKGLKSLVNYAYAAGACLAILGVLIATR